MRCKLGFEPSAWETVGQTIMLLRLCEIIPIPIYFIKSHDIFTTMIFITYLLKYFSSSLLIMIQKSNNTWLQYLTGVDIGLLPHLTHRIYQVNYRLSKQILLLSLCAYCTMLLFCVCFTITTVCQKIT